MRTRRLSLVTEMVSREIERKTMGKKSWRCFHCDEVLITREAAAEHFGNGDYEDEPALCVEAATTDLQKLVLTNREMWAELQKAHAENEELEDHLENFRYVARKLTKKPDATAHDLANEWDFLEGRVIAAEATVH